MTNWELWVQAVVCIVVIGAAAWALAKAASDMVWQDDEEG